VIGTKIAELADQFSTTSYSITKGFKQMQKQIEDLKATITTITNRMELNHAQVMNAFSAKSINK
jgi:predicted PurR-regulated permease PerM